MNRPIGRFKRCYRLRPVGVNPALFRLLQRGSKFKVAHYRADRYRRATHLCKCDRRCLRFGSGFRTASQGLSFSDGKRDPLFSRNVYWLLNERRERKPRPKARSTSFVERQNWTVRTTMQRYTRLSNGFSRKLENHAAATALNYFAYNFIKIHRTLRVSPAMAAGVTDRPGA